MLFSCQNVSIALEYISEKVYVCYCLFYGVCNYIVMLLKLIQTIHNDCFLLSVHTSVLTAHET